MSRSTEVQRVSVSADDAPTANHPPLNLRRRGFLLGLGAASAGVAALALKPAATDLVTNTDDAQRSASGYRTTAHIQNYYRTAKV